MTQQKMRTAWETVLESLALAVLLAVGVTRIYPLFLTFDPWIDEAMLIANLPVIGFADMFRPLPLFEQAAPLGYLLAIKVIFSAFEDPAQGVVALRVFSGIASLIAAGLVYAIARKVHGPAFAVLALVFFGLPPFAVQYGLEIKHYTFEMCAMALMLFLAQKQVGQTGPLNIVPLSIAGCFTILFSFVAPLIVSSVFLGLLVARSANPLCLTGGPDRRKIVWSGAVLLGICLSYHIAYTRPVTAMQFGAYAHIYDGNFLRFSDPDRWIALARILTDMTWMAGPRLSFAVVAGCFLIVGCYFLFRQGLFLFAAFAALLVSIIALSLLEQLPILFPRHFLFVFPLVALALAGGVLQCAVGLARIMPRKTGRALGAVGLVVLMVFAANLGISRAGQVVLRENVTPLLAYIATRNDTAAPVWVYYGAQPVMRVMAPDDLPQIGLVPHFSQKPGWIWKNRNFPEPTTDDAYFAKFRADIQSQDAVFMVFTHHWVERADGPGLPRFWNAALAHFADCENIDLQGSAILWHCTGPRPD